MLDETFAVIFKHHAQCLKVLSLIFAGRRTFMSRLGQQIQSSGSICCSRMVAN